MLWLNVSPAGVAGVNGYELVAVICVLLVIEELGVPLVFAPGDLLLFLAGAAIPSAHLNAVVVLAMTTGSMIAGALAGREVFSRLGGTLLPWVARVCKLTGVVDRLRARLHRGGAVAVFLGRVTPGLRVHTTEVAGLAGVPRRTYVVGLLPAVVVWQVLFVGLGAWVGPAAWAAVQRWMPPPGLVLGVVVAGLGAVVIGRLLIGRRGRRLGTQV